jgi:hypothetical protein
MSMDKDCRHLTFLNSTGKIPDLNRGEFLRRWNDSACWMEAADRADYDLNIPERPRPLLTGRPVNRQSATDRRSEGPTAGSEYPSPLTLQKFREAIIKAGFGFRRWAALAENDF